MKRQRRWTDWGRDSKSSPERDFIAVGENPSLCFQEKGGKKARPAGRGRKQTNTFKVRRKKNDKTLLNLKCRKKPGTKPGQAFRRGRTGKKEEEDRRGRRKDRRHSGVGGREMASGYVVDPVAKMEAGKRPSTPKK